VSRLLTAILVTTSAFCSGCAADVPRALSLNELEFVGVYDEDPEAYRVAQESSRKAIAESGLSICGSGFRQPSRLTLLEDGTATVWPGRGWRNAVPPPHRVRERRPYEGQWRRDGDEVVITIGGPPEAVDGPSWARFRVADLSLQFAMLSAGPNVFGPYSRHDFIRKD